MCQESSPTIRLEVIKRNCLKKGKVEPTVVAMEAWNVLCDRLFLIGSYIHMIKLSNSYLKGCLRYSDIHLNDIEHKKYAQT